MKSAATMRATATAVAAVLPACGPRAATCSSYALHSAPRIAQCHLLTHETRRPFSAKTTPVPPANNKRVHETPIVENCGGRWMSWLGKGSATQMYCSLLFSANMILRADPAADIYEVVAAGGAISSASACVFFGAKLLCDRVVTDIISFRNIGDKDEFVRISVLGAVRKQSFSVEPSGSVCIYLLCLCYAHIAAECTCMNSERIVLTSCLFLSRVKFADIQLLAHDGKDSYKFQVGERQLSLDTATGTCVNRKALEILLQGKPLVTRRGKTSKKPRA